MSISGNSMKKTRSIYHGVGYFKRNYQLYLMLVPLVVLFIMFRVMPLTGLQVAFRDFNIFRPMSEADWVGLHWFRELFGSRDFTRILRNTITISLLDIVFLFPAPIIFALLLTEIRHAIYKKLAQSFSYLPFFLSWAIVGGMFISMMQPFSGLARHWFELTSNEPRMLIFDQAMFYPMLITATMWREVGWASIIYMAAISGIDPELHEAAIVDGASRFRRVISITLPGLAFIISLQLIFAVGNIINQGFDRIMILANDMTWEVADVFSTYAFRIGIGRQRFSFNTALGLFESSVSFVLVFAANKIAKMMGQEGIF